MVLWVKLGGEAREGAVWRSEKRWVREQRWRRASRGLR
jgi:hypothetical protein